MGRHVFAVFNLPKGAQDGHGSTKEGISDQTARKLGPVRREERLVQAPVVP